MDNNNAFTNWLAEGIKPEPQKPTRIPPTKQCFICKEERSIYQFSPRSSYCRLCAADYRRKIRLSNPEREELVRASRAAKFRALNEARTEPLPDKICRVCHLEKPGPAFTKCLSSSDGRTSECKECRRQISKKNRDDPRIKRTHSLAQKLYNEYQKKWKDKQRGTLDGFLKGMILQNPKTGLSRRHLKLEDVLGLWNHQQGKCALTGDPMTILIGCGAGKKIWTNASLDRIDPTRPYDLDNIQLVCLYANTSKSFMNMETLIEFCRKVIAIHGDKYPCS